MAQGNIIQGQASGKLGDTVLMVRKGKQVARVYTTSGARSGDAASEAARYQRVRFGAASNQWGLYRYICTRMFRKGRKTNQSDYNYFVKRNISNLPFLTKGENANNIHVLMPGQFSEGNLGRIELFHNYYTSNESANAWYFLQDFINDIAVSIKWTDTLSKYKNALKKAYPHASKISILFLVADTISVEEAGIASDSQFVQYDNVLIDLYNEQTTGENNKSIKDYFATYVSSTVMTNVISTQTEDICQKGYGLVRLKGSITDGESDIFRLAAYIFATNDNVNDCYTTIQPAENTPNKGLFSAWYGYRTMNALIEAAQSYGYQTGVMRDEIASVNDTAESTVNAYAKNLAKVDAKAAEVLQAELDKTDTPIIKASRKKVDTTHEQEG